MGVQRATTTLLARHPDLEALRDDVDLDEKEIEVHDSRVLRLQDGSRPQKDRQPDDELTEWSQRRHAEVR